MIDKLISFALTQRLLTLCLVFALIAAGTWSLLSLPIDSFPDVSNVQVTIVTEPESMATEEVESLVTYPIETSLNGLPKIKQIRSNSSFGLSVVTAIFEDDMDLYLARQLVQQRLNQIELPAESPKPLLGPVISSFSNVYMYYLDSTKHNLIDLRTIQDWQIAKSLRTVPGVENVVSYGGFVKQYQVLLNPLKLQSFDLTIGDALKAVAENNKNVGGNFIERGDQEVIIRGLARIEGIEDIENIVFKSVNGVPIYMKQVADIQIGPAFRRGSASMNGQGETVTGMVMIRRGANTKAVVERIKQRVEAIQSDLPEGVSLVPYYDQTELVDKTIETVKEILVFSGGLVIIILAAVLMHIPSALIVSVVIPLSLLFSFIAMKYTGLSANLMTLGAVDFGIIVDAGVVMVENIFRQLSNAQKASPDGKIDRLAVVTSASKEVGKPIVFAILIIVAVYLPLFTLEGVEGKMFHPLALTFIYALFGSLLVSLTFIPVLAYWVLRKPLVEKHNPVLEVIRKKYEPLLERAIHSPRATLGLSFGLLIASLCLVPFLGTEFIPALDEGSICVRVKLDPSVSHTTSRKVFGVAEAVLKKYPEVTVAVTKIGRSGMGPDLEGIDMADIYIGLKPKSEWKTTKSKEELVNRMAADISKIPGLMFSFSQPIADMIDDIVSGLRADLGIKVFGESIEKVDEIAEKIQGIVKTVPGAADINRELCLGLPQLNIRVNRKAIARYGLNASDVQRMVESALAGTKVTEVIEGNKRFDILVRFNAAFRANADAISGILVSTPSGMIPLKSLAEITEKDGVVMVNREEGQRRAAVLVNVRGRDLGTFVSNCQERIAKEIVLPKGYRIVWGGQFENQQRATARLSIVVPIVLLLIFLLLFSSFNSLKNAALVMLNVPFAMIGGIVALFVSHQILSVPALIGFIALFGIAVQNGVILVSYIMQLEQGGKSIDEAIREGAYVRFRPVLMTALVATVGLVPKVLSDGTGAEIQRPLATVILGGLVSSTFLTLVVMPSMYALINKHSNGTPRFRPWNRTPACVAAVTPGLADSVDSVDEDESPLVEANRAPASVRGRLIPVPKWLVPGLFPGTPAAPPHLKK